MKKIIFLFVLALAFLGCDNGVVLDNNDMKSKSRIVQNNLSSDLEARLGNDCVGAPGVNCAVVFVTDTISVPSWQGVVPGCDNVSVSYFLELCQEPVTNALVSIHISSFSAVPSFADCPELYNYWSSLTPEQLTISIDAFLYRASLIIETLQIETKIGTPNTNPGIIVNSTFTKQLCYFYCVNKAGGDIEGWDKTHCGTICCHRTRNFSFDSDGNLVGSSPTFEEDDTYGTCGENPVQNDCVERSSDGSWPVATSCETHSCGSFEEDWF